QQVHLRLLEGPAALAVVASGTGSHQVVPKMLTTQPAGHDVIDRQLGRVLSAVLAGVAVAAQDLTLGQPYVRPRPVHHFLQPNDRWRGVDAPDRSYLGAPVEHQTGFSAQYQSDGAPRVAHIDRLEVGIQ